jgi:hypothetical protein
MPKCVSGCKGFPYNDCNKAPRCTYINGEKNQYCRLAHKYKMGKHPDCQVTRRLKKAEKHNKSAKIIQQLYKRNKNEKEKEKENEKNKDASNVVARFMRRTTHKRRAEFLKAVCSDSGVCMAFGTNRKKILEFFGRFTNMDYAVSPVKKIGNVSHNGFVKEIKYEKRGYTSYAVFKSSSRPGSDNLAYEYIVGQFINEKSKSFPCFIDTYGLYYYNSDAAWNHSKNTANINASVLRRYLTLQQDPFNYKKICNESKHCAILIEHLKGVVSLGNILFHSPSINHLKSFFIFHLPYVLYQIYFPLSVLHKVFTHYDLHQDNILLYQPIKGKHIKYHYHYNGSITTFNSPYIVKIIDYGRSFYRSRTLIRPREIYDEICNQNECIDCGDKSGLSWLDPVHENDNYFISSSIVNPSHDLRIMNIIKDLNLNSSGLSQLDKIMFSNIINVINKVVYGEGINEPDDRVYGTKPNMNNGLPLHINNVVDAEMEIRNLLKHQLISGANNASYNDANKIGDMHIYPDGRPVSFIQS